MIASLDVILEMGTPVGTIGSKPCRPPSVPIGILRFHRAAADADRRGNLAPDFNIYIIY
jgi:hypothetical protein